MVVFPEPLAPTMPIRDSMSTSISIPCSNNFSGAYPKPTSFIRRIGRGNFSGSGNLKMRDVSSSGGSNFGSRSNFLIRDCASEDFAALYLNLSMKVCRCFRKVS